MLSRIRNLCGEWLGKDWGLFVNHFVFEQFDLINNEGRLHIA